MILTTTEGQGDLPRYFAQVFGMASKVRKGRLDIVLPRDLPRHAEQAA